MIRRGIPPRTQDPWQARQRSRLMAIEARVFCSIWGEPPFRALTPGAQRMYLFLVTQPDLSMCGLLVVREKFWATCSAGLTPADVRKALAELGRGRFVVEDDETGELLVRARIRRDRVLAGPKLWKPLLSAISCVGSEPIRQVIAEELIRCLDEGLVYPALTGSVTELLTLLQKPVFSQVNTLFDTPSDTPADRDRNRNRNRNNHLPTELTELTEPPATGRARARTRARATPGDPPGFAEFWSVYPRKTAKGAARAAWAKAIAGGVTSEVLITAAGRFRDSPTRKPDYTPHPATWLNQERWEDDPEYGHVNGSRPGTSAAIHLQARDLQDQSIYDTD